MAVDGLPIVGPFALCRGPLFMLCPSFTHQNLHCQYSNQPFWKRPPPRFFSRTAFFPL